MALNWLSKLFTPHKMPEATGLRLFNTLTGHEEDFVSLSGRPNGKGKVTMYNCGPTVYNFAHIGNYRSYVFADILRRTLEINGYAVDQVINITDVGHLVGDGDQGEDKMSVTAKQQMKTAAEIAEFYTAAFYNDLAKLTIETKHIRFPKATKFIPQQIEMIKTLESKGYTYTTSDGVYYDTSKFPHYGKLGNINLAGLEEGARIGINPEKKNPTDFALWKLSKESASSEGQTFGAARQQEWPSPWGIGFPGWSIECSAMATSLLGETIDIHTGGIDHIPVHHNNEIAQSEAATGKPFANYWLHNSFITVDGTKISKSLGNVYYIKDLEEKNISPLAYRYWLLTGSYRTTMNFTWEAVAGAQTAYRRLLEHFSRLGEENGNVNDAYYREFLEAINADLNTPVALAKLWHLLGNHAHISKADMRATVLAFDLLLGLSIEKEARNLKKAEKEASHDIPELIQKLAAEREQARLNRDFKKSDEIRAEIKSAGYDIKDTPEGSQIFRI